MPYNMNVEFCAVLLTHEIPDYYWRSFWVVTWHRLAVSYEPFRQHTVPVFVGQIIHFFLDCFTLEDRKDRLSQNTGNY
jgi:hypothetical protein